MKSVFGFLSEVRHELSLVVWPKKEAVVRLTAIVLVICGIVGVFVGGLDYLYTKGLELLIAR